MSAEVRGRRAGVEPVRIGAERIQDSRLHQSRERLPLDRHPLTTRNALEHPGFEDVGARVDQVGRRLVTRRLLDERLDPSLVSSVGTTP